MQEHVVAAAGGQRALEKTKRSINLKSLCVHPEQVPWYHGYKCMCGAVYM